MDKKIRLIYDECTPTRDRRPTTKDDVYDDVHIEEFDDIEELYDHLLDMAGIDREEDEEGYKEEGLEVPDIKQRCINLLGWFDDLGDGSPNILYLNIDGEEIDEDVFPYDGMENLDLANCSEEEVQENIIANYDYFEDDEDEYDEPTYCYEEAVEYIEDQGVSCDPGNDVGEYVCDLLDEEEDDDDLYLKSTLDSIIERAKEYKAESEED